MKLLSVTVVIVVCLVLAGCTTEQSKITSSDDHLAKAKAAYEKAITENEIDHDTLVVPSEEEQYMDQTVGTDLGQLAPDFTVTSTEGKEITLSEFTNQNKPVLVYFMSTWCPYCAQDFKTLSTLYEDYEGKVEIVVIDLDLSEDADLLREYKQKYPALESIPFAPGKAEILTSYNVLRTTAKYAVGRHGRIIYTGSSDFTAEQWKTLLDRLETS